MSIHNIMDNRTTIQIPRSVLDRLQRQGHKGQTYADILNELMDVAERERFIEEQIRRARDTEHRVRANQA